MKKLILSTVCVFLSVFTTADDVAKETLIERLEASTTLSADFIQRTYKESQTSVDESSGLLKISKPLRFAWFVNIPFEQQVISDGETLWIFDPDLEQATYQSVKDSVQQSPAMILSQPRQALTGQYDVTEAGNEELVAYRLYPLQEDSVFLELTLVFVDDVIAEFRILDSLGQETVISFQNVVIDKAIEASVFEFTPPPGTDLFEQM